MGQYRMTIGVDDQLNSYTVIDHWKALKEQHARCLKFVGSTFFTDDFEDVVKLIKHHAVGG